MVRAYFKQNVHVLVILEHMLELDDVIMVQRLVNFDFRY